MCPLISLCACACLHVDRVCLARPELRNEHVLLIACGAQDLGADEEGAAGYPAKLTAAVSAGDGAWDDDIKDDWELEAGDGSSSVFEGYYRAQGLLERSVRALVLACNRSVLGRCLTARISLPQRRRVGRISRQPASAPARHISRQQGPPCPRAGGELSWQRRAHTASPRPRSSVRARRQGGCAHLARVVRRCAVGRRSHGAQVRTQPVCQRPAAVAHALGEGLCWVCLARPT